VDQIAQLTRLIHIPSISIGGWQVKDLTSKTGACVRRQDEGREKGTEEQGAAKTKHVFCGWMIGKTQ
jgi:hypothetical protein